ncbi:hypothetical protein G7046_g8587 [Stylonectria norvegica]|nr:hypothetical protein G7046_g8587 [Stylonectria norvegica]
MVSTFPMQSYYRAAPLTVDTHHAQKYFEDEDNSVLDDNILDQNAIDSGLELSPPMADSRRDSFIGGPPLFSPKTEDWQSVDMQSVPSNNPFVDQHSNNPFMRLDQNQPAYGPHVGNWALSNGSGSCTPLQHYDGLPSEFDSGASVFQRPMPGQTPFSNPGNMFSSLSSSGQSIPTSPQKDWMGAAQPMKKMRPGSPTIRSHNDLRRGDGIRKKNARFDIPAERNLSNIDHLISQSTDDQEIKELKQQKRLLRNRQAALDSRQRKKQHTERLEDEKKHFTAIIGDLEDEVSDLRLKMEQLLADKQSYADYIETLNLEKEEMIRVHTIETGELRKKVGVLTDHVQRLETNAAPSGVPGSNGFPGAYDDMNDMTMGGAWDTSSFLHEYPVEPEVKQEMAIVPVKKTENNPFVADAEKPAGQGGLLFMLFLVGAFVLSSRSTPSIPRVSEDVRAASATLLDNVLKDAGVGSQSASMQAMAPQPSGAANWGHPAAMPMNDMAMEGVAPSMLAELGDALTQPSQEQTNEQIFSLSAAQYNGVNSQDFLQNAPERSTSQGRRNLADALAAMRGANKQNGAADVYTRSLLWDQIPNDVQSAAVRRRYSTGSSPASLYSEGNAFWCMGWERMDVFEGGITAVDNGGNGYGGDDGTEWMMETDALGSGDDDMGNDYEGTNPRFKPNRVLLEMVDHTDDIRDPLTLLPVPSHPSIRGHSVKQNPVIGNTPLRRRLSRLNGWREGNTTSRRATSLDLPWPRDTPLGPACPSLLHGGAWHSSKVSFVKHQQGVGEKAASRWNQQDETILSVQTRHPPHAVFELRVGESSAPAGGYACVSHVAGIILKPGWEPDEVLDEYPARLGCTITHVA